MPKHFKGTHGVSMTRVKRKKERPDPKQRAHKYQCWKGHIRIEKERLKEPLPICPACEQDGRREVFRYIGRYTIPKNQVKKSKFNK